MSKTFNVARVFLIVTFLTGICSTILSTWLASKTVEYNFDMNGKMAIVTLSLVSILVTSTSAIGLITVGNEELKSE